MAPHTSAQPAASPAHAAAQRPRLWSRLVLGAHRLAMRHELAPEEWGREVEVDEHDPRAVAREWLRQVKLWMTYNPEEVFAVKVVAGLAVLGLLALYFLAPIVL